MTTTFSSGFRLFWIRNQANEIYEIPISTAKIPTIVTLTVSILFFFFLFFFSQQKIYIKKQVKIKHKNLNKMRSVTAILALAVTAALAAPAPKPASMTELDAALKALEVNAPADADAIAHGGHLPSKRQDEVAAALASLAANDPAEAAAVEAALKNGQAPQPTPSLTKRQTPAEIQAALDALRSNDPAEADAAQSGIAGMMPAAPTPAPKPAAARLVSRSEDDIGGAVMGLMESNPEDAHQLLNDAEVTRQNGDDSPDQPPTPGEEEEWSDKPAPPPGL